MFEEEHSWDGLSSANRLLRILRSNLSLAEDIGAPVDCASLVPAFGYLLEQAPLAPLVPVWPARLQQCRQAVYS